MFTTMCLKEQQTSDNLVVKVTGKRFRYSISLTSLTQGDEENGAR